jgi:hypothetical protein
MSYFDSILEDGIQRSEATEPHRLLSSPKVALTELIRVVVDEALGTYLNQQEKSTNIQLKLELNHKKNTLVQLEKLERHFRGRITQISETQGYIKELSQLWRTGVLSKEECYTRIKQLYL